MQIAFWSPWHGRGTTSNCIATALSFSLNYNANCLLTHSQYVRSTMEQAFLSGDENEDILKFNDTGIDSLERLVKGGQLLPEDFNNYCRVLIKDRLDLLTGSKKSNKTLYSSSIGSTILNILDTAKQCYDFTFIDVNSGVFDDITKKVLKSSDIVVVTLEQNEKVLNDFFQEQYKMFENQTLIICLGKFDTKSKCSKKYINVNFNYKNTIYGIPYCTDFLDAINNHQVLKFFYTNSSYPKKENIFFFDEVNALSNRIAEISNFSNNDVIKDKLKVKTGILTLFKGI